MGNVEFDCVGLVVGVVVGYGDDGVEVVSGVGFMEVLEGVDCV